MKQVFVWLMCAGILTVCAQVYGADDAVALVAKDLGNEKHELSQVTEKRPVLLVFVSPYCPTANRFMTEINAIVQEYEGRVSCYLVHADAGLKREDVLQHVEMNAVKVPVLLDEEQVLMAKFQVTTTPEVVVIGKGGKVLYQGRINDWYLTPTKRQRQATVHDLRDALEEVLAGKEVSTARTEAVGCKIASKGGK